MRCSKCDIDNREGRKFCANCGVPLAVTCPKCGASNQPGEKFCGDCGAGLTEVTATKPPEVKPVAATGGERRHLTVFFCDLVGSTEIAARLDPEEWRETVAAYHHAAAVAITRYGGHVAKYLGDGVMAYFGWPEAHDNDAERAARAGLAMLEAISRLNERPSRPKLSARVGIDSGTVVVGAGAGKDAEVFGHVPNIAARVQSAAEPDTVLITASAHRLISGLFVVENALDRDLKGVPAPMKLFRVVRPTGVRGRLAAARELTPFVGRQEELRLMLTRWERARDGEGQVVLVVGEAGIGKSRLVAEFHEQIRDTPHIWMESAGEQLFENTPFHAISEMLSQWMELQGATNADEQTTRLELALSSAGLKPDEAAPVVADFLKLPVGDRYRENIAPDERRRRLLAVLSEWVLGAARLQPMVMLVEDLHWLDPSTLELQQLLAAQGGIAPLMLLYTARPELRQPWPLRSHHTQITLNRLSARDVEKMVAQVAAHRALARDTLAAVIERTSGVPLFVEELTRALLESGESRPEAHAIPETLHDSLMARLDRLGTAKEVAQLGAVIGPEFTYELLQAVSSTTEAELRAALAKLADVELIYSRGIPPEAVYRFKHALIRDAAYDALLKSRRMALHRRVAQTIEERFPLLREAHPEVVARHWTEARERDPAIAAWQKAGKRAVERCAYHEAELHYRAALALLSAQPESTERDARELELRQSAFSILQITRGYSALETIEAASLITQLALKRSNLAEPVTEAASQPASELVSDELPASEGPKPVNVGARVRTTPEKFEGLDQRLLQALSRWAALSSAGEFEAASLIAGEMFDLASQDAKPIGLAYAHMAQITSCYRVGNLVGSEHYYETGRLFFDDKTFRRAPGAISQTFGNASQVAFLMGRVDEARSRISHALSAARESGNPYNETFAQFMASMLHLFLGEPEEAEASAFRSLRLSDEHKFPQFGAIAKIALGRSRGELSNARAGVDLIRQGMTEMLGTRNRTATTIYLHWLCECHIFNGAMEDAIVAIEKALNENSTERCFRPENLRLRSELRLMQGSAKLAEEGFRETIKLAQIMVAKISELRAMTSLARLLVERGQGDKARAMLGRTCSWFRTQPEIRDIREARGLLSELGVRA
jgi:class 3 adenylate cyclase